MRLDLHYLGRSGIRREAWGLALAFSPNLARPKVFFDAELLRPVRFREAISALHDVVTGDLRHLPRDRTAYLAWKAQEAEREAAMRREIYQEAKRAELSRIEKKEKPPGLDAEFKKMHALYWTARRKWANELSSRDPELFRHLVPCDPVVTVAPDAVLFECFSKDESSYGCLTVDRDAFQSRQDCGLGTTNVDYSLALYEHFQTLRSYRSTRLQVDPRGFEVKVEGSSDYREEKIDLPSSWLRGFGQLQAAMMLPATVIPVSREAVYSILAHLKRHREKSGPRCLTFKLTPGLPAEIVLQPWGVAVHASDAVYQGERSEEIKVWGRRRLMVLARLLPLAERFEVCLLGSGLPSIWTAHMGEMRFTLGLSGWTANDWTSGANLDLLAGHLRWDDHAVRFLSRYLEERQQASLPVLEEAAGIETPLLLGSLHRLAKLGQVLYDSWAGVYRFRRVMPEELSESVLGPESPELIEGMKLFRENAVRIARESPVDGRRLVAATCEGKEIEAIVDADGIVKRARCFCSHFYRFRLRSGLCRHLLALRLTDQRRSEPVFARVLT
ncbi:MAG: hypothetical protein DIJKHBIC_04432 [Thermoanaerobaculia bacterium]|nr:hypothetical protein [Thermoanaerobaculia bacterium]